MLRDLMEHATQPEFVYTHRWRVGDMVMWDNRCTMHRARKYDVRQVRELHRTTVMEEASTLPRRHPRLREDDDGAANDREPFESPADARQAAGAVHDSWEDLSAPDWLLAAVSEKNMPPMNRAGGD